MTPRLARPLSACIAVFLLLLSSGCGSEKRRSNNLLASGTVGPEGGTVAVTDPGSPAYGTQIVIPPGALAVTTPITIHRRVEDSPYADNVLTYELGPSGTTFAVPVAVTLKYLDDYLTDNGITDPESLHVVSTSGDDAPETHATRSQDVSARTVTAEVGHFSTFAVLGYSTDTLSGEYAYCNYMFDIAPESSIVPLDIAITPYTDNLNVPIVPSGYFSDSGVLDFDGTGGFTFTESTSEDGAPTGGAGAGTYAVAPDGTVTIGNLRGGVLAGGSAFILSATSGSPQILVGIRKPDPSFVTSMSGDYWYCSYLFDVTPESAVVPVSVPSVPHTDNLIVPIVPTGYFSDSGTLTFDEDGSFVFSESTSEDGATTGSSGSGSYSAASGGGLTIGNLKGCVTAGGDMFVLGATSGSPQITIGIRKDGAFTGASLKGKYSFCSYMFDVAPDFSVVPYSVPSTPFSDNLIVPIIPTGFFSDSGTLVFDGVSGFTFSETTSEDGATKTSAGSGSYAVGADGRLTIGNLRGGVLPGGSMFILAATSGSPQILVGIRR